MMEVADVSHRVREAEAIAPPPAFRRGSLGERQRLPETSFATRLAARFDEISRMSHG